MLATVRTLGLAAILAIPGGAASSAGDVTITLPIESCRSAHFGVPALLGPGKNLLTAVSGEHCGYVSLRDGRSGAELRRLTSPSGGFRIAPGPGFGAAADVRGRRLVVGAPDERAVHAFDLPTGRLLRTYQGPPVTGDGFAMSVVQVGVRVVVGAPFDGLEVDEPHPFGVVHVFETASGRLERSIRGPDAAVPHGFGVSVARLAGDRIAVGTLNAAEFGTGRIFVVDARTGDVPVTLRTPKVGNDFFGGFTTTRDRIIVGAPGDAGPTPGGVVVVYDAKTGGLVRTIPNPGAATDAFGAALAVRGRMLLVVSAGGGSTPGPGTIYLYDVRSGRLEGRAWFDARDVGIPPLFLRRGFAYTPVASAVPDGTALQVVYRSRLPAAP